MSQQDFLVGQGATSQVFGGALSENPEEKIAIKRLKEALNYNQIGSRVLREIKILRYLKEQNLENVNYSF